MCALCVMPSFITTDKTLMSDDRLENCKNLFLRVETLRTVARIKSRQRRKYNLSTKSRVSIGHNDFKTKAVERYNELANGKLHYVQKCKAVKTSNSLLLNSRN